MKITNVEGLVLRLPVVTEACDGTQDTCLVRIETDEGITGWGEVDSCPTAVKAIIDAPLSHQICRGLAHALVGADPLAREECRRRMELATAYYGRSGVAVHAMAGVDIALWDLAGKAYGVPVHQLLGGPITTSFRAYASVLFEDSPGATGERGRELVDAGFTAVKFGWGPMGASEAGDLALVAAARTGVGDALLLVDAGQPWDARTALRRAHQFAEYDVGWIEEPLAPTNLDGYAQLCAASPVPIAAGEAESRLEELLAVLAAGVDWLQPDPARCGLTTMVAAGQAAVNAGRRVANHSFKSGITLAASLHALAVIPGTELLEMSMAESPLRQNLTNERFDLVDGYVSVPSGPGLGVTVDEEVVATYRVA